MMDSPITNQPKNAFGMEERNNPDNVPGLQILAPMQELKIKQRRPECLERKNRCFEDS